MIFHIENPILEFSNYAGMRIKPKMFKYLKEKSGCNNESFWKAFEMIFVQEVKMNCPNPCSSRGLPEKTLGLCKTFTQWQCADREFENTLKKVDHHRYSPCNKLEYEGKINIIAHPRHILQNVTFANQFIMNNF